MRGTKPVSCNGLSAVPLEDRILILKKGSKPDDQIWFLEVGVLQTQSLVYSCIITKDYYRIKSNLQIKTKINKKQCKSNIVHENRKT